MTMLKQSFDKAACSLEVTFLAGSFVEIQQAFSKESIIIEVTIEVSYAAAIAAQQPAIALEFLQ